MTLLRTPSSHQLFCLVAQLQANTIAAVSVCVVREASKEASFEKLGAALELHATCLFVLGHLDTWGLQSVTRCLAWFSWFGTSD